MKSDALMKPGRIDWVDYAKGICIIAVVTMYATGYVEDTMHAQGWMHYLVDFAQPFRMPDFFFLSGLFVSRAIARPLRSYIDSKVLHFVYFYAVWVTIKFLLVDLHGSSGSDWPAILSDYLYHYIQPSGQLWFIYILPLFFIVVRVAQPLPALVVIAIAITLKLADPATGWKLVDRFGMYFIFFYSGHAFAAQVVRMVEWARHHVRLTSGILALWFAANMTLVLLKFTFIPIVHLVTGYAGAAAILLLSVLLARLPWMRWLRYLGENSIVVFLAFVVPMFVMRSLISKYQLITDIGTVSLTVVVVSIIGALMMYWTVRNTPLRFLFDRPDWASIQSAHRVDFKKTVEASELHDSL